MGTYINIGNAGFQSARKCYIPNKEVAGEMVNAIEDNNWTEVIKALNASEGLLQATLDGDEEASTTTNSRKHISVG
jgi:hypothetical protein